MNLPLTIKASPWAVASRHCFRLLAALSLVIVSLLLPESIGALKLLALGISTLILVVLLVKVAIDLLRIKNTTYTVYADQIQLESYLLPILGVENTTINLPQIRQITAYSNSLLDIWFFSAGGVSLTVSGDELDFDMRDVRHPAEIKELLEGICFGSTAAAIG